MQLRGGELWTHLGERATPTRRLGREGGGGDDASLSSDHLWAKLLLGSYALAVRYDCSDRLDCLLLDLDFSDVEGHPAPPLVTWKAGNRAALMDELAGKVKQAEEELSCWFSPHWMASGGKGVWLHLFFTEPLPRSLLRHARHRLAEALSREEGEYTIRVDTDNLGAGACRMPLSRHQQTGELAVFLEPGSARPCEDQLGYVLGLERDSQVPVLAESSLRGEGTSAGSGYCLAGGRKGGNPGIHPPPPPLVQYRTLHTPQPLGGQ